ncbi:HGGxSTG domain-containing protein [Novosphingobium cyanobacteriorum]|uniref:HGGxSTG domain-containing protein n=1 Tax=Novosphingobium cyanobacteriorum TaxID=3024215 RepID=UPI0034D97FFE
MSSSCRRCSDRMLAGVCRSSLAGKVPGLVAQLMPADDQADLRAAYRRYWRARAAYRERCNEARSAIWQAWLVNPRVGWREPRFSPFPTLPAELQSLTCGARTRAGTPCKRRDLYISGRCKLHGGMSTGPTSKEGKAKVARNGMRRRLILDD